MEKMEIINLISREIKNGNNKFKIFYNNGKKPEIKRLFISDNWYICYFKQHSTKRGYELNMFNVNEIIPINRRYSNQKEIFNHNCDLVIKYLTASGMWANILERVKVYKEIGYEKFIEIINNSNSNDIYKLFHEKNIDFSYDDETLLSKNFIKHIKYSKFGVGSKEDINNLYNSVFFNASNNKKTDGVIRWRYGYDNRVSYRIKDEEKVGWYSEEFQGCGNGHYYIMLDNCHAAFREDD